MSSLTTRAVEDARGRLLRATRRRPRTCSRSACCRWLYDRPTEVTEKWIRAKFDGPGDGGQPGRVPGRLELRRDVGDDRRAGQGRPATPTSSPAPTATSTAPRRPRSGWSPRRSRAGCRWSSARTRSRPPPTCCTRSSRRQDLGVRTIQAEDEIAAASIALGAAFGGALGVTCTSGPGLDLKTETIGLAVMLELPMVIIDVQRAGPVDRHADQDRAVRPAAGAVRAPRRVAAAGASPRRRPGSASRPSTRRCGSRSPTARR